jgi:Fe-S oxidoreductase
MIIAMDFKLETFFDVSACKLCGKCLTECPALNYPEQKAKEEKQKLIHGEKSEVLEKCKSCFSCDRFCPNSARPYGLILFRWFERYGKEGIPVRALGALPVEDKNFLHYARKIYNSKEKAMVAEWQKNANSDLSGQEVFFAGCNTQLFPYIFDSPILAGPKIFGEPGLCCGEVYYRMGLFDRVAELGKNLAERYKKIRPAKVITFCAAGYNMQKNILPKQFGVKIEPEIVYIADWLLQKAEKGELKFTRPLNRKVVLQESCHSKVLGDEFMEKPRKLLKLAGAEIVEMNPCRERQICCGVADGITHFNPLAMTSGGIRQWRLAKQSKADVFAAYCSTCYLMMKMSAKAYPSFLPSLHLLELLTYAAGHPVESLADKKAGKIMVRVIGSSTGRLLSKKRVYPKTE